MTRNWVKFTSKNERFEIFPPELGYTVFRRDRATGKGGGVFLLVRNNLLPTVQQNLNTNCEIIWIKLEIKGSKPFYISSFYKPHESDISSILELEKSLDLARKLKGTKVILGDFNLPKISWDSSDHTPSLRPGSSSSTVYDKFIDILNDHDMTQMVSANTRNDKVLDLLPISNPTLINRSDYPRNF